MCRILICAVFLAVNSTTIASQEESTSARARGYEIRFMPGPKGDPLEVPEVEIAYTGTNRVVRIALESDVDSVDEVHYAGNRCIVMASLMSHAGRSVYVIDANAAKIIASAWCFRPVMSPKGNCVVFEKWAPKMASREVIWPTVLVLPVKDAENGPVQIYPDELMNPGDPLGDNHLVVSPKMWNEKGNALAFLDKYGDYGNWKSPYDIYAVIVQFKDGKPLPAKRALIEKETFVATNAHPEYIGFSAESLEISDGKLRGKLVPEDYWIRRDFFFDLAQIEKEQPLGIDDIREPAASQPEK